MSPLEPGALARFEREAKAVASLSPPNILAIFGDTVPPALERVVEHCLEKRIWPDGSRVVIAGREMVSSLVLLEGVAGLGPSK